MLYDWDLFCNHDKRGLLLGRRTSACSSKETFCDAGKSPRTPVDLGKERNDQPN